MPHPKFPADRKRSFTDVEYEAQRARRLMGFGPEEPVRGLEVFERLERLRTGHNSEITTTYLVEPLAVGVEGETRYNRTAKLMEVVIPEATYSGLMRNEPRDAYTVGHETGHVVQHHGELQRLSRIPRPAAAALMRGEYASLKPFEDVEWQADAFAAAYLAPASGLRRLEAERGDLTVFNIMSRYGLSFRAANRRLLTYGRCRKSLLVT
jgi:IrrE N-terminal-like domain